MHLTISVAVSLRDFYCSLSHGAASVWVFGFGATDSLCPFAISLARHLLSLSRSRFPHWGHVISSGVWMWQENDSVLGSQFSVLSSQLVYAFPAGTKKQQSPPTCLPPLFLRFFFFVHFRIVFAFVGFCFRPNHVLHSLSMMQKITKLLACGSGQRRNINSALCLWVIMQAPTASAHPHIRIPEISAAVSVFFFFFFLVPANRQQQVQRADSFRPSFYVYPYSYYLYFIQTALGFGIHFCGWDLSTPKRFIYCGFLNSARMSKMSEDWRRDWDYWQSNRPRFHRTSFIRNVWLRHHAPHSINELGILRCQPATYNLLKVHSNWFGFDQVFLSR